MNRRTASNCFIASILARLQDFSSVFDWKECKFKQWTEFFWRLSKCKLQWVASKVDMNPFGQTENEIHSLSNGCKKDLCLGDGDSYM